MIIRILHEGQYDVPDTDIAALNTPDDELVAAIDAGDTGEFTRVLAELVAAVRRAGTPVPDDTLVPSALVLPAEDTDLAGVRAILRDDGLIPG